ncbi:MAG: hypothetical protein SGJ20_08595 [Planctomycetota bacterium]|nr:hypothetical protein [Planctomycetota bacterium]
MIGPIAFAVLTAGWCVFAASDESKVVGVVVTEIEFVDCPPAIQKTIHQETVGAALNEVVKVTEDDKSFFNAEVTFAARDYEILVAEDGTLIEKVLVEEEEMTSEVKFADCPVTVQKTLSRESRGAKIETVYEVTQGDKTEYVIEATLEGKNYEIIVAKEGLLVSKLLDEDDEEERKTEEKAKEA